MARILPQSAGLRAIPGAAVDLRSVLTRKTDDKPFVFGAADENKVMEVIEVIPSQTQSNLVKPPEERVGERRPNLSIHLRDSWGGGRGLVGNEPGTFGRGQKC
jgi:hypothetical protein